MGVLCFIGLLCVMLCMQLALALHLGQNLSLELVHCHQEIYLVKEVLFTLKYALGLS